MLVVCLDSLDVFEENLKICSQEWQDFVLVFDEYFSLVGRSVDIVIVIFNLQVENDNRIHIDIILLVKLIKYQFNFPRHVNWPRIQKAVILVPANLARGAHAATQDSLGHVPVDFHLGQLN